MKYFLTVPHDSASEPTMESEIAKDLRVNERIRAREVRLIDEMGAQVGAVPFRDALDMAKSLPGALINTGKQAGGTTKDAAKGAGGLVRGILGR
mgnify:CR=1 FL=1